MSTNNNMCAIYVRVSQQKKDKEKFSIPAQIRILTEYAKVKGWKIYGVYNENENRRDASGENLTDRPKILQLLADTKEGKFQYCLVIELERLSRSEDMFDWLTIRKTLVDNNVQVVTPSSQMDLSDEDESFLFFLFGSLSSREKKKTLKRLRRGAEQAARSGIYLGTRHVRYGYRYDKNTKKLIPVPEEVETVKLGFKKISEGMSIWSFVRYLTEQGYRNRFGNPFTTRHWSVVLRSKFYLDGHLLWNGIRSEKPVVVPIIDETTWEKANDVIDHNSKHYGTFSKRTDSNYILQGCLKCDYCSANMVGASRISNHKTRAKKRAYRCGTYISRTRASCPGQSIDAEMAESQSYEILKRLVTDKDLLEMEKEEIKSTIAERNPELEKNIRMFKELLTENKKKQKKCLEAFYAEAMTQGQFKEENSKLQDEEKGIEKDIKDTEKLIRDTRKFEVNLKTVFSLLDNFDGIWNNLENKDKKLIYRIVFKNIYVEQKPRKHYKKISRYELYEPFKSMAEYIDSEKRLENQCENSVLQLRPSVVR